MSSPLFPLSVARSVARIRVHEPAVSCYVTTRLEEALDESPSGGALRGVPFGIKDEFHTPDMPTTGGSYRHRDRRPKGLVSAPFVAFESEGAVLVGKTNLSDLGLAPEATSFVGGATKNPFDRKRTSGGSSGGSAAAVAYGLHAFDWGTDIGGSIRLPAAFCGVLGLRLSDETWPITDLFPSVPPSIAWLCGQGPFTRTVEQMRAILDVTAPSMKTGAPRAFELRGMQVYAPLAGEWPTFAEDVRPLLDRALDVPVRSSDAIPPPKELREIYAGLWASHFDDLLAADPSLELSTGIVAALSAVIFRGALGDRRFHPTTAELLLLIALGRVTFFRDREKALARGLAVREMFRQLWDDGQLIAMPVAVYPPPFIGRSNWNTKLLAYTIPGNLADATGLSIPFGTFDGRLPRGIQLLGPPGSERVLLDLAERIIAERDADPSLAQPAVELPDPC